MAFLANLFGKKKKKEAGEPVEEPELTASAEETAVEPPEEPAAAPAVAETLPQEEPTAPAEESLPEPETIEAPADADTQKEEKKSFWARVKSGILKTKNAIFGGVDNLLKHFVRVDEDLLEELEELLISADVGVNTTEQIIDELRDRIKDGRLKEKEQITDTLREILEGLIGEGEALNLSTKPSVILVIGVNGVGKTTAIGKISNRLRKSGKKVVVAAADTFRAAAIDQLEVWCERAKVQLVRQSEGSDPAAVVFDACHAAKNQNADVLIIDTAGRQQNQKGLMEELAKILRIIRKQMPEAPHETLLTLDAGVGTNALSQAREFAAVSGASALVLTKLDGTGKGGAAAAVQEEFQLPILFVGLGEAPEDLQTFSPEMYAEAIFPLPEKE